MFCFRASLAVDDVVTVNICYGKSSIKLRKYKSPEKFGMRQVTQRKINNTTSAWPVNLLTQNCF